MDASTLGKIDIRGKDVREFLNRVYANAWTQLAPGKCRYGLMLDENGMVMDDGVTSCIADDHFLMTTTTGGAARVMSWLEQWHQTEWPELDVYMTSVTDHWATAARCRVQRAGRFWRRSAPISTSSTGAFKFMDWRAGTVAGVPARVFRISFSGELAFEVNVDASYGHHVWEALMEAGAEFAITPYGTETMHVLRAEKGFIIVGQDTDGSMTPYDLDMAWAVSLKKPFSFIGKRSFARSDTARSDRKQLVGLLTDDPAMVLKEGRSNHCKRRCAPAGAHARSRDVELFQSRTWPLDRHGRRARRHQPPQRSGRESRPRYSLCLRWRQGAQG